MHYNIKGTALSITDELRDYVEKKLGAAEKFLNSDPTAHIDIELEYAPLHDPPSADATKSAGGKYRAEFFVSASGKIFRVSRWGSTMHEAIDLAAGELSDGLRRNKRQRIKVLRRSAVRVKEFLRGWRKKV